jgi:hypothetical protein
MLEDILRNDGAKMRNAYEADCERELVSALLPRLSEAELYKMYETGMMHDIFITLSASFPPLKVT